MRTLRMKFLSRRQFLGYGLLAGAATVGAGGLVEVLGRTSAPGAGQPAPSTTALYPSFGTAPAVRAADVSVRRLVVIDMAGGNDGVSMVPPIGNPLYAKLRPRTSLDPATVLPLTAQVALHPSFTRLHGRGLAIVQGVGVPTPDLSHFEMLRRWYAGDMDSTTDTLTGFLGRLCDAIGDASAAAVGVSLGYGPTPALVSAKVSTVSMDPYGSGGFPAPHQLDAAAVWTTAWKSMAEYGPTDPVPFCSARKGAAYALRFSDVAKGFPAADPGFPTTELGAQLSLAARVLAQDNGVRVVHVPFLGDFDTHQDHLVRHAALMTQLDDGLDAFLTDLERRGIADRVLVATTSEFGRRMPDNASDGLDHGAASFALFSGPVIPGLYGAYPRLDALDRNNDLVAQVTMAQYYATIAEGWFGVPATDVVAGSPTPLTGIVAS
ncbi:MAG: DUF1501 domain-containing protein [Candidatus Limnocylindrales bacterium]